MTEIYTVHDKASNAALRVFDSDIMTTVTANAARPESTVDIHLNIATSVNIDDLFTIVLAIRPYCAGTCNEQDTADSWLSIKAVNKATRSVDFTMGGMLPGKRYTLETSIFGLVGAPCSGHMLSPVNSQTATTMAKPLKMRLKFYLSFNY